MAVPKQSNIFVFSASSFQLSELQQAYLILDRAALRHDGLKIETGRVRLCRCHLGNALLWAATDHPSNFGF